MIAALPALLRLADAPRRRLVAAAVLGALTVVFGVGLMATAGYLISRAAEHPPILSLTVAIVGVRLFGLGRPIARYLERLASHDLALRALGAGADARLRAHRAARAGRARGLPRRATCSRAWSPTSTRSQNLYLRGLLPPVVALLAGGLSRRRCRRASCPAAGLVLAGGLLARRTRGARAVAAARGRGRGAPGRRPRRAVGRARRAAARRARARRLRRRGSARWSAIRDADAALVGLARRDALAAGIGDGLGVGRDGCHGGRGPGGRGRRVGRRATRPRADRDAGAARAGVVRGGRAARRRGPRAVGHARRRPPRARAGRRASRRCRSGRAGPAAGLAVRGRARGRPRPLPGRAGLALDGVSLRLEPGSASRSSARAAPARPPSPTCCCASSIPKRAG